MGECGTAPQVHAKKHFISKKNFGNDLDVAFFLETHHKTEDEIPREILRYTNTHHIIHSTVAEDDTHRDTRLN